MTNPAEFDNRASSWDSDPAKHDRARRVGDAIASWVPDLAGRAVLDYGAGTGLLGFVLLPRSARVTFADVSRGMLAEIEGKIARAGAMNASAVLLDLTRPQPFPERFDLVCTLMTLHHVADIPGILKAFHATLAPGGLLCIADLDEEDGSFHGPGFIGHNGFSRIRLERQILGAGFGAVRFATPCEVRKGVGSVTRVFPVFLAIAQRLA
jgi:SAM-dependent methyltransferase